jgi:hypothetical protein
MLTIAFLSKKRGSLVKIISIRLKNFRSFNDSGLIEFGQMNVLIGANNSGKSSVLRGLHQIQHGLPDLFGDVRVGSNDAQIDIELSDMATAEKAWGIPNLPERCTYSFKLISSDRRGGSTDCKILSRDGDVLREGDFRLPNEEPNHFIVPILSKRKVVSYIEDTREKNVMSISSDMSNLAAKLIRLANPYFPAFEQYANACKDILGFVVTHIPSSNGQRPGIYLPNRETIAIDQMGEGVPNIVHLLVNLAVFRRKVISHRRARE